LSGVKEERSISLLLRLDLEFSESTPKTLINSLHATARNFDTPSYWTLTVYQGLSEKNIIPSKNALLFTRKLDTALSSYAPYVDRSLNFPHKIDHNDLCYKLFKVHGFTWGGDWVNSKDYQKKIIRRKRKLKCPY